MIDIKNILDVKITLLNLVFAKTYFFVAFTFLADNHSYVQVLVSILSLIYFTHRYLHFIKNKNNDNSASK